MKKIKYLLIVLLSIISFSQQANAQNDIQVSLSLLPPYSPYFSDYLVYENKTTLILTGPNALNRKFYLRGTVTGDNGITISTKQSFKPAQPLQFTNGPTLILKGIDLEEYFKWDNANVLGTDLSKLAQGDGLPEGTYTICIRAYDYTTNEPLSQNAPSGCVSIDIKNIEPPIINLPQCGNNITPNPAQNMVFSWNPPPGAPANTKYLLKMAEMQPGFSNYNDALNTLTTPAFYEKEISTSTYSYTLADAALTIGKTYAFKVVAFDPTNKINFRNNGESEVCYFTYGNKNIDVIAEVIKKDPPKKATKISYEKIIKYYPTINIKGTLQYAFHKDEESSNVNYTFASRIDGTNKTKKSSFASYVNSQDPTYKAAQLAADKKQVPAPVTNTDQLSGKVFITEKNMVDLGSPMNEVIMTAQEYETNTINKLIGKKTFGYANKKIKIYFEKWAYEDKLMNEETYKKRLADPNYKAQSSTKKYRDPYNNNKSNTKIDEFGRILLGIATTDDDGNFSINAINDDYWSTPNAILSIDVDDNDRFIFATENINAKADADGNIDLGKLIGLAITYQAKITIKNEKSSEKDESYELKNASYKILRKKNYYDIHPELKKEIDGFDDATTIEGDYVVVGKGKSGSALHRLFYADLKQWDRYLIAFEDKDFKADTFKLGLYNFRSDATGKLDQGNLFGYTLQKFEATYTLKAHSYIKGTAILKQNNVPFADKPIYLNKNGEFYDRVVTDSAGRFDFGEVEPDPKGSYSLYFDLSNDRLEDIYPSLADGNSLDPQHIVMATRSAIEFKPLYVSAEMFTVKGTVKNDEAATISNAQLKWKQGGSSFYSGNDGSFLTSMIAGEHILVVNKSGYRETEIKVKIEPTVKSNSKNKNDKTKATIANYQTPTQFTNLITSNITTAAIANTKPPKNNTPTPTINLSGMQIANNLGYFSTAQLYNNVIGNNGDLSNNKLVDVGDIIIKRFYVKVTVKDFTTKAAIDKASVQAKEDGIEKFANASGIAVINDAKGTAPYIIVGDPTNGDYISQEVVFDIKANKDTAEVFVELKKGSSISGKVLVSGAGAKDAQVFVEGKEYITVKTDNDGKYKLALPDGEYTLKAAKQGLQGDSKVFNITSTAITHDFTLTDPGFDAAKLLGFDIELYESKAGATASEKIISGAFIKIPDNNFFKLSKSFKLPFNNIKVNINAGKAMPVGDEVVTTVSEIPLELFEYLPLKLKSSAGIKVKKNGTNNEVGKIVGFAALDINTLLNKVAGLTIPVDLDINLSGDGADKKEFTVFMSNGALPLDGNNLKLLGANTSTWKLYGTEVSINYDKSFIFKDGLQLAGSVKMPGFPVIGGKTFNINQFKINTGGDVNFDVSCNLNEEINFSVWKLRIGMLQVSNYGVNIGGMMGITLPETDKISVSFSKLNISSSGVGGGQFNLYSQLIADQLKGFETKMAQMQDAYNAAVSAQNNTTQAIDQAKNALNSAKNDWQNKLDNLLSSATNEIGLFKIVTYSPVKNVNFSLSKIPGKNDYKLEGGGVFGLKKYIDDKIKLNYFAIATDGNFAFDVPVNLKQKFFGIAEIELNDLGFSSFDKSFTIGGKVFLKIPGFGIGAGTKIIYYQGGRVDVKELSIKLDIGPIGAFEGGLAITDNGFRGKGALKVAKVFDISGSVLYEKEGAGVRFGVDFNMTPSIVIPVGLVNIGVKGGGFEINTNPGRESVMVVVRGSLSLVVDPAAVVGINPLELKITVGAGGPILEGSGTAVVATINVGKAGFKIDYPAKYMTIYAEGGLKLDIIPGAPISATAGFRFSASLASGNEYIMAAMFQEMNIANIAKAGTNIAFGWGVKKNQGTAEDQYLQFIPDDYLTNGKVFGFGFKSYTQFGVDRNHKVGFDFWIVKAQAWYYNASESYVFGNFKVGKYGFKVGTQFDAGGELRAVGLHIGSVAIAVAGSIGGGYGNGEWFANVDLRAELVGEFLCCDDGGCETGVCKAWFIPCGIEFCIRGHLYLGLSNKRGADIRLSL